MAPQIPKKFHLHLAKNDLESLTRLWLKSLFLLFFIGPSDSDGEFFRLIHPRKLTWFTWTWAPGRGDSYYKLYKPSFSSSMLNFGGVMINWWFGDLGPLESQTTGTQINNLSFSGNFGALAQVPKNSPHLTARGCQSVHHLAFWSCQLCFKYVEKTFEFTHGELYEAYPKIMSCASLDAINLRHCIS